MQRKFRVWRELPPRICSGADSRMITSAPASAASIAAQSAALPPPMTTTSYCDITTPFRLAQIHQASVAQLAQANAMGSFDMGAHLRLGFDPIA